jgi:hypothetical protein
VGKPEGKKPLARPRLWWMNNMKMDLVAIVWVAVNWTGLAQDRSKWRALVNAVMNLRVPLNTGNLSSGYTSGGPSSSAEVHRFK